MSNSPLRPASDYTWSNGAIIRGPKDQRRLALIFTGGSFGEGGMEILDALAARHIKGSFFFTGEFLSIPEYEPFIRRLIAEGHYLGPHSHAHLLYCPWEDRSKTLVTREQFMGDLDQNLRDLERFGVDRRTVRWWIPPYEWYNEQIAAWSLEMNMQVFNFTPGTLSHTDYTVESEKNYRTSDQIMRSLLEYPPKDPDGFNGFLLLTHVGAGDGRRDNFFKRLPALLDELRAMQYEFARVDELLSAAPPRQ